MRRAVALALIGLLLLVGSAFAAVIPVPPLTARVTDQTGTLDAAEVQTLESKLAAFEQGKGSQIAILIVPTTGDETIEQYSIRVTDQWKLGRKGVDDGVLLLVAKDDHKVRIEVGRGLEGEIPDVIANRIIDEDIVPKFHDGDFAGGVKAGIDRMIGLVNGEPLPPPKPQRDFAGPKGGGGGIFAAVFAFLVARGLFSGLSTFPRGALVGGVVGCRRPDRRGGSPRPAVRVLRFPVRHGQQQRWPLCRWRRVWRLGRWIVGWFWRRRRLQRRWRWLQWRWRIGRLVMALACARMFADYRRSRRRCAFPTSMWVGCRRSRRLCANPTSMWVVACIGLLLFVGSAFAAAVPVPPLTAHVNDVAGLLKPDQAQALEAKLASFEDDKGGQVAVLIVPTTGDETIEQYSIRVVDAWKLGRKGVDDGVLVLVAKDDRKVRIEVGRGYEGVLPDVIANRIIDGFITPKFLAGDYAGGLNDGVDRIIGVVNGESLPQPPKVAGSPAVAVPAGVSIPSLVGHVVNQTTLITPAQARYLDGKLAKFEADKGRKIAILLASDIGNESCDDYAQRVFKAWNLGGDGSRDAGVLIAECEEPFGHLMVVGRDLQGTITPAIADRIYSEDMVLKMISGDEVGGLQAGVDRIIDLENGKPMPAKPENSFGWETAADWFSPPPLGTWTVTLVGMIFLFFVTAALLGWKSVFVRGGCTFLTVGAVPLIAGSGIGFALIFAIPAAFMAAIFEHEEGPEPKWDSYSSSSRRSSSVSGWSIFGSILGMVASSALSSGGSGGGGFRGGGGGFSGGGASGSW